MDVSPASAFVWQHFEQAFEGSLAQNSSKPQDCDLGVQALLDAKLAAEPQWLANVRFCPGRSVSRCHLAWSPCGPMLRWTGQNEVLSYFAHNAPPVATQHAMQ